MDPLKTMTREEIEQLPAGRELDALLYAKLFDCLVYASNAEWQAGGHKTFPHNSDKPVIVFGPGGTRNDDLPRFSTDIAAAWQVVEHWHSKGFHVDTHTVGLVGWAAKIVEPDNDGGVMDPWPKRYEAAGDTAQLAICRAALLTTI